ncbi:MAG TPA: energy-coupling factor transporter transmembrane component T [Bacillota bacterium]
MNRGRASSRHSFWRRRDPRIKIMVLSTLIILTLLEKRWQGQAMIFLLYGFFYYSARVPFSVPLRAVYSFRWLLGLTFLINLLFITEGRRIPGLPVTDTALNISIVHMSRLINLILSGVWLMRVTDPLTLIKGVEGTLAPVKRFLPVGEIALVLGLALQFLPVLIEKAQEITMAQQARGLTFHGNFRCKIKGVVSIVTPLFLSTLRHAAELAQAMEARAFIPGEKRGSYEEISWKQEDTLVLAFLLCLLAGWVLWRKVWR